MKRISLKELDRRGETSGNGLTYVASERTWSQRNDVPEEP